MGVGRIDFVPRTCAHRRNCAPTDHIDECLGLQVCQFDA